MSQLRQELTEEVGDAKQMASDAMDWRQYPAKYPLATVAIAALAGYLLVPSQSKSIQLSDKQLKTLAKQGGVNVTAQNTAGGSSLFKSLVATAGAFAVRAALQTVTQKYASGAFGGGSGSTEEPV